MCTMCEFAVQYIEGYLEQNMTETQIIALLDQLCELAPSTMRAECTQFVQQEVPTMIQFIVATESPQTACVQLGMCDSVEKKMKKN